MAATLLHFLSQPNSPPLKQTSKSPSRLLLHNLQRNHFSIKCSSSSNTSSNNSTSVPAQPEEDNFPSPNSITTTSPESFPIEKRRKSEILRERRSRTGLVKPEPPNFEVGWKRTKEINLEKPIGFVIMDFLEKLQELMERDYGSTTLLAKAGEIVAERAREEAEVLRDEGKVEERMVTELSRVLRLMEMDLAMVKAAVKEETLGERLEQAKARCRQAILVANSF
ncbi:Chlororespiratory reduction 41 [Melia azedarach]|uniref:Chlororespiratory reduction 41 n=1 Tax=Melia azedarach TaxID=155640 RepID=A0ACC1YRQ0_MELAZ|nr:Chlororespiratory reduction 41 [Melia azedarach]